MPGTLNCVCIMLNWGRGEAPGESTDFLSLKYLTSSVGFSSLGAQCYAPTSAFSKERGLKILALVPTSNAGSTKIPYMPAKSFPQSLSFSSLFSHPLLFPQICPFLQRRSQNKQISNKVLSGAGEIRCSLGDLLASASAFPLKEERG